MTILVDCPTAFLAKHTTHYCLRMFTLKLFTLHSTYPLMIPSTSLSIGDCPGNYTFITKSTKPFIEFTRRYDAIFIDEIGMLSLQESFSIWETVTSLPIFPTVVFCGDDHQLSSFATSGSGDVQSFFNNHSHIDRAEIFLFTKQCRCYDDMYNAFLKDIR